jgi:hypothetical protein
MRGQKQRKNGDVLAERGDPFGRVHRDNVGVKPEKIAVKKGKQDAESIAEHKQPDETEAFFLDH